MRLDPCDQMPASAWDEAIAAYDTVMFYHGSAWLNFLEQTQRGRALRFRILDNGACAGYFVALLVRKGPFRILGSPISGSMSEYMGPIAAHGFRVENFLSALDGWCRQSAIHQLELGSPMFTPSVMEQHGYERVTWKTYRIPLSSDEDAMWESLDRKARNRIRRGLRNELIVEDVHDDAFIERHFNQVREVFAHQGLVPPWPPEHFRILMQQLKPRDQLFTLEVRHRPTREVVASGIFPHDSRRVYSFSTASWIAARALCPNELLHWTVMRLAANRGLRQYNTGDAHQAPTSGGKFKGKFNGRYESVDRYLRHYSAIARHARRLYVRCRRMRQRN